MRKQVMICRYLLTLSIEFAIDWSLLEYTRGSPGHLNDQHHDRLRLARSAGHFIFVNELGALSLPRDPSCAADPNGPTPCLAYKTQGCCSSQINRKCLPVFLSSM